MEEQSLKLEDLLVRLVPEAKSYRQRDIIQCNERLMKIFHRKNPAIVMGPTDPLERRGQRVQARRTQEAARGARGRGGGRREGGRGEGARLSLV